MDFQKTYFQLFWSRQIRLTSDALPTFFPLLLLEEKTILLAKLAPGKKNVEQICLILELGASFIHKPKSAIDSLEVELVQDIAHKYFLRIYSF